MFHIRAGGLCEGGGDYLQYLKGGGTEKRGGETDILKRGKLGQGVGALKRGNWNPLTNCDCLFRQLPILVIYMSLNSDSLNIKTFLGKVNLS